MADTTKVRVKKYDNFLAVIYRLSILSEFQLLHGTVRVIPPNMRAATHQRQAGGP